jgi:hypothetical protein
MLPASHQLSEAELSHFCIKEFFYTIFAMKQKVVYNMYTFRTLAMES